MEEINRIAKQLKIRANIRAKNIDNLLNRKKIDGYDNYSVSNRGEVRNDRTDKILKGILNRTGYIMVSLCSEGKITTTYIHRLVANAFLNNPLGKICVDHINNNRTDNNIVNLRYATRQENNRNMKIRKDNTSNVKGVSFNKGANKWHSRIVINNKTIHIGYFETLAEAKTARRNKAKELFGEYINDCEL